MGFRSVVAIAQDLAFWATKKPPVATGVGSTLLGFQDGEPARFNVPASGVGTVTSVNLGASTGLTPSGGPITGSGSLTYTLSANLLGWNGLATSAKQDADATLTALAAANWAANALPIGSGADTVSQVAFAANTFPGRSSAGNLVAKAITDFGFSLVDDVDAATARTTLGAQATLGYTPVNRAGDTMTGDLTVSRGATEGGVFVNTNAGVAADFRLSSAGSLRWIIRKNTAAESGSNAGSDFQILSRTDAGAALQTVLSLRRSDGLATFAGAVAVSGSLSASVFNAGTASGWAFEALDGSYSNTAGGVWRDSSTRIRFINAAFDAGVDLTSGVTNLYGTVETASFLTSKGSSAALLFQDRTTPANLGGIYRDGGMVRLFASVTGDMFTAEAGTGNCAAIGTLSDLRGDVRDMPRVTGGLTAGCMFATGSNVTLNTGLAAGRTYGVYNNSGAAITLTQGGGLTLRKSGTGTTGNLTLAQRGFAFIWCNSTTEYIVNGDI